MDPETKAKKDQKYKRIYKLVEDEQLITEPNQLRPPPLPITRLNAPAYKRQSLIIQRENSSSGPKKQNIVSELMKHYLLKKVEAELAKTRIRGKLMP